MDRPLTIGYHARKIGFKSYDEVLTAARELINAHIADARPCVALFVTGPRNTHLNITPEYARNIAAHTRDMSVLFHASYLDLPWGANPVTNMRDNVFERIDAIMNACAFSHADVVIHCGTAIFDAKITAPILARIGDAIEKACDAIEKARDISDREFIPRVFIETMNNDARFASPDDLNAIFDTCDSDSIGLCVDTAHIWGAGANISTREKCANWFDALRSDIPYAMHLNDSTEVLNSHSDIHTTLGSGEIWGLSDGYVAAVQWARERNAPVILERNKDPMNEAARDLALISRKLKIL